MKKGVFGGDSNCIKTYALVHLCDNDISVFAQSVKNDCGHSLSLNDGNGNIMVFNLSPEQIIELLEELAADSFIYGKDVSPSIPYFYHKEKDGLFHSKALESIDDMLDLEVLAPECSELWEDLYFDDLFRETLYNDCEYNW